MANVATDPGQRSAHELEREVDAERQRVSETIDALQQKVSVGSIVDEVVRSVGTHGGDVSRNLGRALRDNPMAVLLTGVGVAWLIAGSGPGARYGDEDDWDGERGYRRRPRHRFGPDPSRASAAEAGFGLDGSTNEWGPDYAEDDAAGGIGARVSSAAGAVADRVGAAAGGLRETAASVGSTVSETVSDLSERAGQGTRRAARAMPEMPDVRGRLARSGRRGMSGLEAFLEEQPLVAGALALAVGAAVGSVLPRTRTEDELFGQESDRLKEGLRATAAQEGGRLARSAAAVADEARTMVGEAAEEIARQGATAVENMEGTIDAAGERLRQRAVEEAGTEEVAGELSGQRADTAEQKRT